MAINFGASGDIPLLFKFSEMQLNPKPCFKEGMEQNDGRKDIPGQWPDMFDAEE